MIIVIDGQRYDTGGEVRSRDADAVYRRVLAIHRARQPKNWEPMPTGVSYTIDLDLQDLGEPSHRENRV